jgi:hypothetical protein
MRVDIKEIYIMLRCSNTPSSSNNNNNNNNITQNSISIKLGHEGLSLNSYEYIYRIKQAVGR